MTEGRDQRRYPRFEAPIRCTLKLREGPLELVTADVSRHGAFLRTDAPRPERELIQIHFQTPVGELDAMCMVVRAYPAAAPGPRGPGMGVDFFAISKPAKDLWDAFVADVKIRGHDRGASLKAAEELSSSTSPPVEPPRLPGPVATSADPTTLPPPLPGQPPRAPVERKHVRQKACFLVRMADKSRLREFLSGDVSQGGMFLKTPVLRAQGDLVELVLVHPESHEEYLLSGTVVRVVEHEDMKRRGLGIRFERLDGGRLQELVTFIETGVAALRAQESAEEKRLVELEQKAKSAPDSADTQLALGRAQLEEGDGTGALSTLTKALVLAPDRVDVHRALEHTYAALGDASRQAAHARVAQALSGPSAALSSSRAQETAAV